MSTFGPTGFSPTNFDSHREDALIEDLLFLARQHVSWEQAIARTGHPGAVAAANLARQLYRWGRRDVLAAFKVKVTDAPAEGGADDPPAHGGRHDGEAA